MASLNPLSEHQLYVFTWNSLRFKLDKKTSCRWQRYERKLMILSLIGARLKIGMRTVIVCGSVFGRYSSPSIKYFDNGCTARRFLSLSSVKWIPFFKFLIIIFEFISIRKPNTVWNGLYARFFWRNKSCNRWFQYLRYFLDDFWWLWNFRTLKTRSLIIFSQPC